MLVLACAGFVPVAQAAFMIPGAPIRPKDFTLTKKDGYYHLFFIRNNTTQGSLGNECDFGHAISNDLYHWTQLPPVLHTDSLGWDNQNVWAPHVIERDGLYWMFYTGVQNLAGTYRETQRIGCAVSTDLNVWSRLGEPVFDTSKAPWAWWSPLNPGPACRDPFVMPDPNRPGMWLMYYTAGIAGDSTNTEIGIAQSDGSFSAWTDLEPVQVTSHVYSSNSLTESPHLFQHDGLWYLFITTSSGQPLTFYTSPDPTGDLPSWTYRGRLRTMLGYDTSSWFASECFRDGTRDLFAFVQGDRIEIRQILWGSSGSFALIQPPLFHVVQLQWVSSVVREGEAAGLRIVAANPYNGIPQFETFLVDSLGAETPVPPESLGFDAMPQLSADTTIAESMARRFPIASASDTVSVTRVRIRTTDRTAQSDVLTILAPPPAPPAPSDSSVAPDNPPDQGDDPSAEPEDRMWHVNLAQAMSRTSAGADPAVVLMLPQAIEARVDLYDVLGRRVRNLAHGPLRRGSTTLSWDGRADDGTAQPHGIYFVRLTSGRHTLTTRLLYTQR